MNENQPPTNDELERQLLRATSSDPLDRALDDAETLELREAWEAFGKAAEEVAAEKQPPIGSAALWDYLQQDGAEADAPQREQISLNASPVVVRSSPSAHSKDLLFLAATAATIAALAFGIWQVYQAAKRDDTPQVVIEDPPEVIEQAPEVEPPVVPTPEVPNLEQNPIVQDTPTIDPIVETVPPTDAVVDSPSTPEADTEEDLYAWDDQLDDSLDEAANTAHEVRYGWRNTSTTYRYISYRFESIDDSITSDSL